jgi:hypothetical protein
MGFGVAISRGWAEQKDETWARITPAGREALRAEYAATHVWFIRKRGYFYRQHAAGYCDSPHEAGRYTYEDALAHTKNADGVTMHKVSEWPPEQAKEAARL